ncbi:MAG: ISL3 family transposase [Chloroflexota bacterium]|nr:ISL3 family transposase [Chloroflexota bacterium]
MLSESLRSPLGIRRIVLEGTEVVLEAEGLAAAARCPDCGVESQVVHDRYRRRPCELPWRGRRVRLALTVRRFRCGNRTCGRATFAEDLGPTVERRARRTTEATALLRTVVRIAGGEAGARLATAYGLPVSGDTLLRLLRREELGPQETPRVLGVDDFALRRGKRYGTLLLNLETHRPVDLLEERTAEALAQWLREHPGVEVVARDRAEASAEGARLGAPEAVQVADRFHLSQNASAALVELLRGRRRRLEIQAELSAPVPPAGALPALSPRKQMQAHRRAARIQRWETVRARHAAGESLRGIARDLGINRQTVRRLLETPEPPRNLIQRPRPGGLTSPSLQPYVSFLQDRWQQGCTNVSQLFREIGAQGYTGSRSLLYQALQAWRPPRSPARDKRRSRRLSVRWLCLCPPEQLDPREHQALEGLLAEDPELAQGYDLLQRFRALLAARDTGALEAWLQDAQTSHLPPFVGFANGILADRAAVNAALTTPWSTGPVEGQIHRVKLIKRQGYGRAHFDLLRRRVLAG